MTYLGIAGPFPTARLARQAAPVAVIGYRTTSPALALAVGDLDGVEAAAERSGEGAADAAPDNVGVYGLQMYVIRRLEGRLAEVRPDRRPLPPGAVADATAAGRSQASFPADLSPCEVDVLRLLATGKSNREIGRCCSSAGTRLPTTSAGATLRKTSCGNRTAALLYAVPILVDN